ncbi:MAG: hypothetical protein H5U40_06510 [Polyangiaceae bacterium]|nr:hypothetical protein [Polyangiaceae bacterium]
MDRVLARKSLSLSLGVALAFMAVWGGRAVLWCPSMQAAMSHCCCAAPAGLETDSPAISRADCCEAKTFEAAPASSVDVRAPSMVAFAPIVASLFDSRDVPARALPVRGTVYGRSGLAPPKTPIHQRNCVYLL